MRQTFKQFFYESEKIQKLAKLLNVTGKDLDKFSEKEVEDLLANLGHHDFVPDSEFDATELKKGIEVEKEHTASILIAKLIAKDHLKEIPDYYTRLNKMEQEAEVED